MSLRFSLLAGLALAFAPTISAQSASPLADGGVTSVVFTDMNRSAAPCAGGESVSETGLTSFFRNYSDPDATNAVLLGQSFTAPCDGAMDELGITIYSLATDPAPEADGSFTLTLVAGDGGAGETIATQDFTLAQPAQTNAADPRVLELNDDFLVTEGEMYTVFYVQTASGFQIIANNAGTYAGGQLWVADVGDIASAEAAAAFDQTFNISFLPVAVATEAGPEGAAVSIGNAVPNPSATSARIPFSLETSADVQMGVYDVLGRQVAVIAEGTRAAGDHSASLDASSLAPGTYVVRLMAGPTMVTRTISVAR